MKKQLLTLLTIALTATFVEAQKVNFTDTNWTAAKKMATESEKFIFIDAYTEWCGWCKVMDKKTFADPAVANLMNERFVPIKMDMEKGFGITMAQKFRVTGFPTFLVFNKDGKFVYRSIGYQETESFMKSLEEATDPANLEKYPGISDEINLDFPQFYKDAFGGGKVSKRPTDETVNNYLMAQKDLFSEINFSVILRFKTSDEINQKYLQTIEQYRKNFGSEADDKVNDIINQKLETAKKSKDESKLKDAQVLVDTYGTGDKEMTKQNMRLEFYSATSNWTAFGTEFEKFLTATNYKELSYVNEYCWTIYESCDDQSVLEKACGWMKEATIRDPQYMYLDTYAAVLYKAKQTDAAIATAKMAIEAGKTSGENVSATEELLEKMMDPAAKK